MNAEAAVSTVSSPPSPRSLADTGLSIVMMRDNLLKSMFRTNQDQVSALSKIIFVCMIAALLLHRIAGSIPAIRNLTPDWESWTQRRYFPFGLALSGILVFYLAVAFWSQA